MLRPLTRYALQTVQLISATIANQGRPKPALPSAHNLLKAKLMAQHIPDGASVLDIGCGDGQRLRELGLFVRQLQATGVDLCEREPSHTPLSGASTPQLLTFDGARLPFEDDSFDVATLCYVLHHLTEPHAQAMLQEAARVAKRALILLEDSRPQRSLAYRLRDWAHATEANLGYEAESDHFRQNFIHTMFKTHDQWINILSSLDGVCEVCCVPLDAISKYAHHTMFIARLVAPMA